MGADEEEMVSIEAEMAAVDRANHQARAPGFWTTITVLNVIVAVTHPPTAVYAPAIGWTFTGAMWAATAAYVVRLRVPGTGSVTQRVIASVIATAATAVGQWLSGGFDAPFTLIFPLAVLGNAAVLDVKPRRIALLALVAATAAPLAYDQAGIAQIALVLVFCVVLVVESAMLADFASRLREQRMKVMAAERVASRQSVTDDLTGLSNRRALTDRIRTGGALEAGTAVYLDLDGFKAFNDRFGHGAGDDLLERRAQALRDCVGGDGCAYRVGGDEFCVLLDQRLRRSDDQVQCLIEALSEEGAGYRVAPSCGVATAPADGTDLDALVHTADARMYEEKTVAQPTRERVPDHPPT